MEGLDEMDIHQAQFEKDKTQDEKNMETVNNIMFFIFCAVVAVVVFMFVNTMISFVRGHL